MRSFICLVFISLISVLNAQEFNAEVSINAEQTGQPNLPIFKTLKNSLEEFINTNKWTQVKYLPQERINCTFFINVSSYNNNIFEATLQVQASRQVFGSGYSTTIANFNDKDFRFEYLEFEPLAYNPNSSQGNLVATISYYLYTVLAIEADSFSLYGGTNYYEIANQIVNVSQSTGAAGWSASSGTQSRFRWNTDMLSGSFDPYREALYNYHLKGLDAMSDSPKNGKKEIIKALQPLDQMNKKRPNSYVLRTFFDAKSIEISRLLSGGPKADIAGTVEMLKNISPSYSKDWEAIKN